MIVWVGVLCPALPNRKTVAFLATLSGIYGWWERSERCLVLDAIGDPGLLCIKKYYNIILLEDTLWVSEICEAGSYRVLWKDQGRLLLGLGKKRKAGTRTRRWEKSLSEGWTMTFLVATVLKRMVPHEDRKEMGVVYSWTNVNEGYSAYCPYALYEELYDYSAQICQSHLWHTKTRSATLNFKGQLLVVIMPDIIPRPPARCVVGMKQHR